MSTLTISEKSLYLQAFLAFWDADSSKLNICKLFWGTIFFPLAIVICLTIIPAVSLFNSMCKKHASLEVFLDVLLGIICTLAAIFCGFAAFALYSIAPTSLVSTLGVFAFIVFSLVLAFFAFILFKDGIRQLEKGMEEGKYSLLVRARKQKLLVKLTTLGSAIMRVFTTPIPFTPSLGKDIGSPIARRVKESKATHHLTGFLSVMFAYIVAAKSSVCPQVVVTKAPSPS